MTTLHLSFSSCKLPLLCFSLPKTLQMGKINNWRLHFPLDLFIEMVGDGISTTLHLTISGWWACPRTALIWRAFSAWFGVSARTPSKSPATPLLTFHARRDKSYLHQASTVEAFSCSALIVYAGQIVSAWPYPCLISSFLSAAVACLNFYVVK